VPSRSDQADLEATQQQLQQALHELEVAVPCHMMYVKTHNTIHMVTIQVLDPLYITSHFPNERSYKQLKESVKSTHHPVASLSCNVAAFVMAVLCQADHAGALSHAQIGLCDCVRDDMSVSLMMALEYLVTLCCHPSLQQLKALVIVTTLGMVCVYALCVTHCVL